ncbi:hypothetical protein O9993_06205 [Vibrio lentus]|nr:hypothetical protein [Vibrio lentus]
MYNRIIAKIGQHSRPLNGCCYHLYKPLQTITDEIEGGLTLETALRDMLSMLLEERFNKLNVPVTFIQGTTMRKISNGIPNPLIKENQVATRNVILASIPPI